MFGRICMIKKWKVVSDKYDFLTLQTIIYLRRKWQLRRFIIFNNHKKTLTCRDAEEGGKKKKYEW